MEIHTSPLARKVIGAAIEVHSVLGPGLLESAYEHCLAHEFTIQGLTFRRQLQLPVAYKSIALDCGYRIDFLVGDELVLEIKAVDRILPIHEAQVLTYLKLLRARQALLINFDVRRLVDGLKSYLM
jgi:GxxExxY protein